MKRQIVRHCPCDTCLSLASHCYEDQRAYMKQFLDQFILDLCIAKLESQIPVSQYIGRCTDRKIKMHLQYLQLSADFGHLAEF